MSLRIRLHLHRWKPPRLLLLGVASVVVLWLALSMAMMRREHRLLQETLLLRAILVANTLPAASVQALQGAPADAALPAHRTLDEQLRAVVRAEPLWQRARLLRCQESGALVHLLDTRSWSGHPDAAPPGSPYTVSRETARRLCEQFLPAVFRNVQPDRQGGFSVMVPLGGRPAADGNAVCLLDTQPALWNRTARRTLLFPSLLTLLLLGALLAIHRFSIRGRPSLQAGIASRRDALRVLGVGLLLTGTSVWGVWRIESHHRTEAFLALSQDRSEPLYNAFQSIETSQIEDLARFLAAAPAVTEAEFQRFVRPLLLRARARVQAWVWVPAPDPAGAPGAAPEYRVRFLLCRDGAEELLPLAGSDLGSLEGLRATFANAVQYPGTLASEPLRLPHATGRHHLLAMRAVRDLQEPQALRGFLVCAIDPQRLLFSAQPPHSFPGRDLEVELLALMPDAPPRRLAVDRARPISLRTGMTRADASDSLLIRPILAFGRAYGVATRPTPVWMAHHTSPLAWMVLFIGLAGTAGAVGKLRGSVHQRRAMEALVEQRTRDLTATMQRYQVLTETMRDVVWILDPETFRFLYVSPAVEPLLGFSVQEVMSWPIDAIVFPEDRDGLRGMIRMRLDNFRAGRSSHLTFFVNEITHRRKDGSALPTETVSRYCWNVETGAIELHGVSRDITERKRTQVYRDLTVATLQILNQPADFDELLQQIADALAEKTGCNRGVGIRMKAHDDYPFAAVSGMDAETLRRAAGLAVRDKDGVPRFDEEGRPLLHCVCGLVLGGQTHPGISFFTEGGSCWTNDLRELAHLPVPSFEDCTCERDGEGSLALVPVRTRNEIIGLIQLRDRRTGMFSLEIVEILEDIASHLGAALLRKRVERDYRLLFHGMLEGFAIQEVLFDDAGAPADFRFLAVNPAFERLSGLSARDTLGKTLGAIEPDLLPFWIESCGRAATEGEPVNFVWYAARERRFIEVAAFRPAPRQIACLFTDVTERIQADRELRESQRQYKSLLAHLQGMVYRCTYDADWTMEFVSDGALALTGFGPDDLIRNRTIPFLTLVLPQNRDRLLDRREEAIRGRRVFDIEYEIVTRDRKVKWVLEQGGGVYDDQGRCVAVEGFITDITERRNAARELERLMAAIEQSGETVMITDASGVIQYVNLAFERITGYTRAEALGHTPRMLKSGVHDAASYRHLWETILGGRMWKGEFVNRTKTGTLYTESVSITPVCSDAGEVVNFVAVRRDITEEKKAAAELAESEYRYRTLADSGTTLIWTSRRDKQCDWFNRPWLDFTGRTLEQELGDGWTESISPEDRDRYLGAYAAAFDRNEPFSIEFRLRHADGGYRWVVTRGTPRFDLAGSFLGYIAHSMDISDLKRAEAEREKIQEQFVQAQKMESIGRLAGGVAHDFNNMLQAILGYTDLALEELAPDKPPVQELLEIQKAAQRSSALTRQLQAFARKQPIAARELDLNECVEGMLNMLRRLIGESIALQWKPGAGLHAVCMDPGQIDQVVVNLCVNARDAIGAHGAGGRIVLETANREVASADTDIHREIVPGSYVMLSVSDNGSGIAHADVVRIFEPFFTTKPKGAGTGLGLSTVYGIVRQNKGGIQVLSAPGEGTTFQIFFPRHAGADSPSERAEDSLAIVRGNGERILLVEDEPLIIQATRRMLLSLGYAVQATQRPEEALRLVEQQGDRFQLVLSDVIMPGMNGPELVKRIRVLYPRMKVLFMSGYTANLLAEQGVTGPTARLLQKPFARHALARAVREALDTPVP